MGRIELRRLRGKAREAHARRVLARFASSGASQAAFCREEGISPTTFSRWLQQFGVDEGSAAGGGFVEVRLDRGLSASAFEIELGAGRRLRIPPGFAVEDLERLLALLDRPSC